MGGDGQTGRRLAIAGVVAFASIAPVIIVSPAVAHEKARAVVHHLVVGEPDIVPGPGPGPEPGPLPPPALDPTPVPLPQSPRKAGYWMLGRDGSVYAFGDAATVVATGTKAPLTSPAVKLLEHPDGTGLWVLEENGTVHALGGAAHHGNVDTSGFLPGERPSTMASAPGGTGYYVFTNRGRALAFGSATLHGDLAGLDPAVLRDPIVDSAALPDGSGYFMLGSDGGVFAFGTARFAGSVPQVVTGPLNAPVNGLVVDPDGSGYWMVAGDGGVFAFDAAFVGSIPGVLAPGVSLNAPVNGMVPYGRGYLMVASDGGVFTFSDLAFLGSLGGQRIPAPIVGIAARSEVDPVMSVRISSLSNRVQVIGEDRDDVSVRGDARVTQDGTQTTIDSVQSRLVVSVPAGTDLVIGTESARVDVAGQVGSLAIVTESGRIIVEQAASIDARTKSARVTVGHVDDGCRIRTTSARVQVSGCRDADVATDSGRITLTGVNGAVRAHCVSGRIEIELDSANDIDAETVSGRITVSLPPGVRAHRPSEQDDAAPAAELCDCTVVAKSVSGRVVVSAR